MSTIHYGLAYYICFTTQMKFSVPYFLVFLIFLPIVSCNSSEKKSINPTTDSLVVSVYANASIESADQYSVYSAVTGRVIEVLRKEGDKVFAGEPLVKLDNLQASTNLSTAKSALENAKNNEKQLLDLKSQLEVQLEQLALDSMNFLRQQRLWQQQIGSLNQLEQRKLAYEASKNAVRTLKNKISVSSKQLEFNTQQAKNSAQSSEKLLSDFQISSAISGDLFYLNAKIGDWITPVKPVAIIGNAKHFVLRLNIDEMDISQIHENQIAIVSLDAYPGKSFKAHISRIIPIMDQKNQSFTVEAVFDELPEKLYPGLSAEVNIITHIKPKALLIPLSYLGKNNKVTTDQGEVEVKTGLRNMQWVEILEGISANTALFEPEMKK